MANFKTALDMFHLNFAQAGKQLRRDMIPDSTDTLSTAISNFMQEVESMTTQVKRTAEQVVIKELLEPFDVYSKFYQGTNEELLKSCEQIWERMHIERN
jgi:hypothetical protein